MNTLSFKEFMLNEGARRTGAKTDLYAMGDKGVGLYPLADYLTHAADAILYVSIDDRLYHNGDGPPFDIRHLPGPEQYGDKVNNGEKEPFPITHIPGRVVPPKDTSVPGEVVPFKSKIALVTHPTMISPKNPYLPPS